MAAAETYFEQRLVSCYIYIGVIQTEQRNPPLTYAYFPRQTRSEGTRYWYIIVNLCALVSFEAQQ